MGIMRSGRRQARILVVRPRAVNVAGPPSVRRPAFGCWASGYCAAHQPRLSLCGASSAGLIRYATESGLEGRPVRVFRPRVLIYGLLLVGLLGAFAYA